jgi:hypothetical protein
MTCPKCLMSQLYDLVLAAESPLNELSLLAHLRLGALTGTGIHFGGPLHFGHSCAEGFSDSQRTGIRCCILHMSSYQIWQDRPQSRLISALPRCLSPCQEQSEARQTAGRILGRCEAHSSDPRVLLRTFWSRRSANKQVCMQGTRSDLTLVTSMGRFTRSPEPVRHGFQSGFQTTDQRSGLSRFVFSSGPSSFLCQ